MIIQLSCMGQANIVNCGTLLAIILVVHEYQDWSFLTEEIQENLKRKKVPSLLESTTPDNYYYRHAFYSCYNSRYEVTCHCLPS